jgi:hypothetical protein
VVGNGRGKDKYSLDIKNSIRTKAGLIQSFKKVTVSANCRFLVPMNHSKSVPIHQFHRDTGMYSRPILMQQTIVVSGHLIWDCID